MSVASRSEEVGMEKTRHCQRGEVPRRAEPDAKRWIVRMNQLFGVVELVRCCFLLFAGAGLC